MSKNSFKKIERKRERKRSMEMEDALTTFVDYLINLNAKTIDINFDNEERKFTLFSDVSIDKSRMESEEFITLLDNLAKSLIA